MSETTTTHTVAVFSAMRGSGWQGQVPTNDLEELFRYFNRVDETDGPRLEAIGYNLPSMMASDLVGLVDDSGLYTTWYLCAGSDWDEILDAQAQTYMTRAQRDVAAGKRGPMFAEMDGPNLKYIGNDGMVNISPSGAVWSV